MRRMNARAPQTFVSINIPHATKNALVEQQRLDSRAPASEAAAEIVFAGFERVNAELTENTVAGGFRYQSHAAEPTRVGVAKLAIVVQHEPYMCVQCRRHRAGTDGELPGHAEMNDEVKSFRRRSAGSLRCAILLQDQYEKFAAAANLNDAATWDVLFDCRGIVDEIRLAEANAEHGAARQQQLKAANDSFDFGKFWQMSIRQNGENAHGAAGAAFEFDRRGDHKCSGRRQFIQVRDVFDVEQARG